VFPKVLKLSSEESVCKPLSTGRVAVAQAALGFARQLFATTRAYSDNKMCTMRGDTPVGPAPAIKCSKHHKPAFKFSDGFGIESKNFDQSQRSKPNRHMIYTQRLYTPRTFIVLTNHGTETRACVPLKQTSTQDARV